MRKFIWSIFILILIAITYLLVQKQVDVISFGAISIIWLIVFILFYFEPETIKKITIWKASIERDVTTAAKIKNEVMEVKEKLHHVTKAVVEDSYIIASSSMLAMGKSEARSRLEKNLDVLSKFVEPDSKKEDKWWKELNTLCRDRQEAKET